MLNTLLEREVARIQLGEFGLDPNLVLYVPLWKRDGSTFMSEDHYGHLATVTGALWRPDGRYFDGVDDDIRITNPSFLDDTQGTIEFWCKTTAGGTVYPLSSSVVGTADDEIQVSVNTDIGNRRSGFVLLLNGSASFASFTPIDSIILDTWHHIVWTSDGSLVRGYIDGANVALTVNVGTNTGQWFASAPDSNVLTLGGVLRATLVGDYTGIIGEVRLYNRALTPLEIQHNYLATKWRY